MGGTHYGKGRVFRATALFNNGAQSGYVLEAPKALPVHPSPEDNPLLFVSADDVEAVKGLPGEFCRVCGCIDDCGCPPDANGHSCYWTDSSHTLCSRCDDLKRNPPTGNLASGKTKAKKMNFLTEPLKDART